MCASRWVLDPIPWESAKVKYWSSAENVKRTAEHSKFGRTGYLETKIGVVSKCGGLLQKSLLGQRKYQLLGSFAWCEGLLIGLWLFFCLFTQRQFVYFCYILLYIVIIQWQLCIIIIQWQVVIWTVLQWYKSSVWLCVFTCIIWISQTCFFYILRASLSSSHICTRRFIWQ